MGLDRLLHFLLFFYCVTAGLIFLLAPWTPGWDHLLLHLPSPAQRALGHSLCRGALSGFGLVHFVWGVHDVTELVRTDLRAHGGPDP